MEYQSQIKQINETYDERIRKRYGNYISGIYRKSNLTENVEVLHRSKCVGQHEDLIIKRGKCEYGTGKIYLREDAFVLPEGYNEHLLIHEYIHRLSCNCKQIGLFERKQYGAGFSFLDGDSRRKIFYGAFNEVLTEWIAYQVTGIKENTRYQQMLYHIEFLKKRAGNDRFERLIEAFFKSDLKVRDDILYFVYGIDLPIRIHQITKEMHSE